MPAIIHFPTNCGGEMELATLWKMEMQYYGKMVCNYREKRLAKNIMGNVLTLMPAAWYNALAIAGGVGTMTCSPIPLAP